MKPQKKTIDFDLLVTYQDDRNCIREPSLVSLHSANDKTNPETRFCYLQNLKFPIGSVTI